MRKPGIGFRIALPSVGNFVLFETAFVFAYRFGMSFTNELAAPFWFPDSVLLSALLMSPPNTWWAYVLATIPIRFFLFIPPGIPFWFLFACFVNDSSKALLSGWLLRHASPSRIWFDNISEFTRYLMVAVALSPALSAFAGAAARVRLGDDFWTAWKIWFFGNALASLVLTPLLVCFLRDYRRFARQKPMRYVEALVMVAGLSLTAYLAFYRGLNGQGNPPFLLYLPVPFLLWAAINFGPLGSPCTLFLLGLLSIFGTIADRGPFRLQSAMDSLLSIQLFLFSVALPFMFLSVIIYQQRKTDAALRESEGRFRYLVDTAPIMVWISRPDALRTFFNKPWLDFTGRRMDEQWGNGWVENVHPADRESSTKQYLSAFASRSGFHLEYRLLRNDGAYRWVLDNGIPRYAPDGSFLGYIGGCIDLTDRKEAEEELRQVSAQLINAQETERFRIGQELHDDVAQRLASLSIGLSDVGRKFGVNHNLEPDLGKLQQQASEICNDIARLSHQLRPVMLEKLGLPVALRSLCEQSTSDERLVLFTQHEDLPGLTETASVSLYRIAQEAVRNALTHSGATRINVELSASQTSVSLSIHDTGCGFVVGSTREEALGLSGMAERMKNAGGSFSIRSSPGQGTTVIASVPILKSLSMSE